MPGQWTPAFEQMLREHLFAGQVALEELLAEEDQGDLRAHCHGPDSSEVSKTAADLQEHA